MVKTIEQLLQQGKPIIHAAVHGSDISREEIDNKLLQVGLDYLKMDHSGILLDAYIKERANIDGTMKARITQFH